ncbi:MAG: hypothetical protein V1929_13720 [bacterium]
MSSIDSLTDSFESIRKSHEAGRLAHAYVIAGSPRGEGYTFAESVLKLILCSSAKKPCGTCDNCTRVVAKTHPDVLFLEPEGKGRQIKIDEHMRPLLQQMAQTSYAGGWKAGVILYADRMNDTAANALLKTLEEPAPRTLFLLVTDSAQSLPPTILSRCQRVVLAVGQQRADGPWQAAMMDVLRSMGRGGALERLALAGHIKAILEAEKDRITHDLIAASGRDPDAEEEEDEDAEIDEDEAATKKTIDARIQSVVLRVRTDIILNLVLWKRDVLMCVVGADPGILHFQEEAETLRKQAEGLTYARASSDLAAAQKLAGRLNRNMSELTVLEASFMGDL